MNIMNKIEEAKIGSVQDKIIILSALLVDLDEKKGVFEKKEEVLTNSALLIEHIGDALNSLRKIKGNGGRMFGKVFSDQLALVAEQYLMDANAELEFAKEHAVEIQQSMGDDF